MTTFAQAHEIAKSAHRRQLEIYSASESPTRWFFFFGAREACERRRNRPLDSSELKPRGKGRPRIRLFFDKASPLSSALDVTATIACDMCGRRTNCRRLIVILEFDLAL